MDFTLFLRLGWDHILEGYDHILFLIVLLTPIKNIKPILLTVSAFTITHTIAMFFVLIDVVPINSLFVEASIAATITYSAISNIMAPTKNSNVLIAALFGLIHGAGFSNYLKGILEGADIYSNLPSVFGGFVTGLEFGQLFIGLLIFISVKILNELKFYDRLIPEIYRMIAAVGLFLFISRVFEI